MLRVFEKMALCTYPETSAAPVEFHPGAAAGRPRSPVVAELRALLKDYGAELAVETGDGPGIGVVRSLGMVNSMAIGPSGWPCRSVPRP